jgi:hypothetical protein
MRTQHTIGAGDENFSLSFQGLVGTVSRGSDRQIAEKCAYYKFYVHRFSIQLTF